MAQIYIATASRVLDIDGQRVSIAAGRTTAEEGAPILKLCGDLFEPLVPTHRGAHAAGPVEQATAAPGERRNVDLPEPAEEAPGKKIAAKKKTAAKKTAAKKPDDDGDADNGGDDGDDE